MKKNGLIKILVSITLAASGAFALGMNLKSNKAFETKAATEKTFYLDCTGHDWDTYDSICLHLWGSSVGDKYYQATQAGDNYWYVTIPDIDSFAGCEFYKCNSVAADHNSAVNLYHKQSWLGFPSSYYYYTVVSDEYGADNCNWSAPVAWSLSGSSSASLSLSKFDSSGLQFYSESVSLSKNDVFELTNGTLTKGFSSLRSYGGLSANEKGQVVDNGDGKIKVVVGGTYEIYVNAVTGSTWMQSDRATEIKHFAQKFNAAMASACTNENADNSAAVSAIWGTWKANFEALTEGAREEFGTSKDSDVVQARKLYVHCVARYGLSTWTGAPSASARTAISVFGNKEVSNLIPLIIVISLISVTAIGGFFFIRKRKAN